MVPWFERSDTCPTCRRTVKGTQDNHSTASLIETLLNIFPDKKRNPDELKELELIYRPGQKVLPPPPLSLSPPLNSTVLTSSDQHNQHLFRRGRRPRSGRRRRRYRHNLDPLSMLRTPQPPQLHLPRPHPISRPGPRPSALRRLLLPLACPLSSLPQHPPDRLEARLEM